MTPLPESEAFELAFEKTIEAEGPENHVKGDKGGVTKYGISKALLELISGGPVSNSFVLGLTKSDAKEILRKHFWYQPKIHRIYDNKIREIVFDQAVNRSPFSAIVNLQRALKNTSSPKVEVDGLLGIQTLEAIVEAKDRAALVRQFVLESQLSYVRIVEAQGHQVKFLRGWLSRAWSYLI